MLRAARVEERQGSSRRALVRIGVAAGLFLIYWLMLRTLTDAMLFYPEKGQWRTPAALGLPFEEVWVEAQGERIQGWWLPGTDSGPVILMFHGNAGTIAYRIENARMMIAELGASVYLAEYPGYGDSEGRPSEPSLFAAGEAALVEARRRAGDRALVVFGRSLGGAVAIHLAAGQPWNGAGLDALIVESSFTGLAELGRALGYPVAGPLLPYRFASLAAMPKVQVPTLVLHGDRDEIVPFGMGKRLYEAATSAPFRRFHAVAGAGHNDAVFQGGSEYWRAWRELLAQLPPA